MSNEYKIRTMEDLLEVPRDRWDAMLVDLREWMNFSADSADAIAKEVSEKLGAEARPMKQFTWCDDGVVGFNGEVVVHVDHEISVTL